MSTYERAVFGLLLEQHPALLSIDEVVRYLASDPADDSERDALQVAIQALIRAGLVHRLEQFVFATAPAVYLERVETP